MQFDSMFSIEQHSSCLSSPATFGLSSNYLVFNLMLSLSFSLSRSLPLSFFFSLTHPYNAFKQELPPPVLSSVQSKYETRMNTRHTKPKPGFRYEIAGQVQALNADRVLPEYRYYVTALRRPAGAFQTCFLRCQNREIKVKIAPTAGENPGFEILILPQT